MEQVQLTITLNRVDARALESALEDLERWLTEAGFHVEPVIEPPAEGEMGAKYRDILVSVIIASLVNESLVPLLAQWEEDHPGIHVQMEHIEVREPKPAPPHTDKAGASSAPPEPPLKRID